MKVLLAVDSSAASQVAVREVAARPWPQNTTVALLNVVDPTHTWNAPGLKESLLKSAEARIPYDSGNGSKSIRGISWQWFFHRPSLGGKAPVSALADQVTRASMSSISMALEA